MLEFTQRYDRCRDPLTPQRHRMSHREPRGFLGPEHQVSASGANLDSKVTLVLNVLKPKQTHWSKESITSIGPRWGDQFYQSTGGQRPGTPRASLRDIQTRRQHLFCTNSNSKPECAHQWTGSITSVVARKCFRSQRQPRPTYKEARGQEHVRVAFEPG